MKKRKINSKNMQFIDNLMINDLTYIDYLERFKKVAMSLFEWVNLPKSMNAQFLEKCLYYDGQATFLKDKRYGFINTRCVSSGEVNIYDLPTRLNCYSWNFQTDRKLYVGLTNISDKWQEYLEDKECILIQNDWDRMPTASAMELFSMRLFEAERTIDVNIKSQKTPVMILINEKQRLMMENLYSQYDGNKPFIFGDKEQLQPGMINAVKTDAPYVADKLMDYKKEIWNEALTFLGINNIMVDKKERLITDEANSNNELINLNLQAHLAPRKEACRQFNEKFGFTGTDKEIDVRVRSDLHNIIKNAQSVINDFKKTEEIDNEIDIKEGEEV